MVERLILQQIVGGDCPADIRLLANDLCLERGLGYAPPKSTTVREFQRIPNKDWTTLGKDWGEIICAP